MRFSPVWERLGNVRYRVEFPGYSEVPEPEFDQFSPIPEPAPAEDPDAGLVYFVQCRDEFGPIKIGYTNRHGLITRMNDLCIGNPYPLRLLGTMRGTMQHELALHKRFQSDRMRGEWFRWSRNLEAYIRKNRI